MGQKLLSICVDAETIKICELTKDSAKSVSVQNAFAVRTPSGTFDDGVITDPDMMSEAIRVAIYGKGVTSKKLLFSINSKKIANKEVLIPFVRGEKKIHDVLDAGTSEYFPMNNVEDYIFGYSVIDTVTEEDIKKLRVNATAVPKEIIESYYKLAERLKMPIEDIDYAGNSILQILNLQTTSGTSLILQIEKDVTYVNILHNGIMVLQRSVPYGKSAVIGALIDVKRISEREAEILISNQQLLDQQVTKEEYDEAVRYLINSIIRIVDYYGSMHKEAQIDEFRLFGDGSAIAGLDAVLGREIGMAVTRINSLKGVNVKGQAAVDKVDSLFYIQNVGSILNSIGLAINVEDTDAENAQIDRYFYMSMIGAAIIVVAWCAFTAYQYFGTIDKRDMLNQQIADIKDIETIVEDYNNAIASYDVIQNYYISTENPNEKLADFISDLEKIMPTSIGITSLQVSSGAVSISGRCTGKLNVAEFIIQLNELGYVNNVFVSNVTETYNDSLVPETTFNMTLNITNPDEDTTSVDQMEGREQ